MNLSETEWERIIDVLEGRVDENDPHFQHWLSLGKNRQQAFERIREKWQLATGSDRRDFYERKKELAWRAIEGAVYPIAARTFRIGRLGWFIAAALALLLVSTGILYYYNKGAHSSISTQEAWLTYSTAAGQKQQITLPDSTSVVLLPLSSIQFPSRFSDSARALILRGSAYFEVRKDSAKPFIVQSPRLQTEVLGTRFQIEAYSDEAQERVFLLDGRVKVVQAENGASKVLQPGQAIALGKDNDGLQWVLEPWTAEDVLSWKEGRLLFREATWAEIDRQLYRHGGIRLVNRSAYGQLHYTGSATLTRLRELLDDLAFVTGLQYHYEGKEVVFTNKKSDSR